MRRSTESLLSALFPDIASPSQINQLCRITRKPHQRQRLILSRVSKCHAMQARTRQPMQDMGAALNLLVMPAQNSAMKALFDRMPIWSSACILDFSKSNIQSHAEGMRTSLHPSIKHYLKLDYILLHILICFLCFYTLIAFLKSTRAYNTNGSSKLQAKCLLKYFINSLSNILQPKILNKLPSLQMPIFTSCILPDSEESCFLHSDQFLSLETASKKLSSGENASWVTVRLWKDKLCSFFQEVVLHKIIAACSFLEACMDGKKMRINESKYKSHAFQSIKILESLFLGLQSNKTLLSSGKFQQCFPTFF